MFYCLVLINLLGVDTSPSRTMGWPPASIMAPSQHHATATDSQAAAVLALMSRWETEATRNTVPWRAEREILRFRVTSRFNGHVATAMEKLLGQIDARQLRESHDWQIVKTANWETCLEAVPKDETERLFYGSIRVWLNTASAQLVRLQAIDRHGEPTAHWSAPETNDLAAVLPGVMSDDGIPPIPPVDRFGQPITPVVQNEKSRGSHQAVPVPFQLMPAAKNKQILLASARLNGIQPSGDHADSGRLPDSRGESQRLVKGEDATTSEINEILMKWQSASALVSISKVQFHRTVYNLVSEEELTSNAELTYDATGRVKLVITHGDFDRRRTPVGKRIGRSGKPFSINHDHAHSFIYTSNEIIQTNDDDKTYEVLAAPEVAGVPLVGLQMLSRYWLPFLLEIRPAELRSDWSFSLRSRTDKMIVLAATPRSEACKSFLSQCLILIDATTWQTSAIKYYDADGTTETVYQVQDRKLNKQLLKVGIDVDLKKYERILPKSGNFLPPQPNR